MIKDTFKLCNTLTEYVSMVIAIIITLTMQLGLIACFLGYFNN